MSWRVLVAACVLVCSQAATARAFPIGAGFYRPSGSSTIERCDRSRNTRSLHMAGTMDGRGNGVAIRATVRVVVRRKTTYEFIVGPSGDRAATSLADYMLLTNAADDYYFYRRLKPGPHRIRVRAVVDAQAPWFKPGPTRIAYFGVHDMGSQPRTPGLIRCAGARPRPVMHMSGHLDYGYEWRRRLLDANSVLRSCDVPVSHPIAGPVSTFRSCSDAAKPPTGRTL